MIEEDVTMPVARLVMVIKPQKSKKSKKLT